MPRPGHLWRGALVVLCVLAGAATVASADTAPPAGPPSTTAPEATASEQLNLPKGQLLIDGFVTVNLSSDSSGNSEVGKPISLTPDIWYGVTDDITIGLVHSFGETGLLVGITGNSLCLTGTGGGCPNFYSERRRGCSLQALKAPLSLDVGLFVESFSPNFDMGIKIGVDGRWRFGKAAIEVQPNLFIELTDRQSGADTTGVTVAVAGNEERLAIPVTGSYTVVPNLDIMLQLGLLLPFDGAGHFFQIPLSIGARYAINPKLSLGLMFSLPALAGGDELDTGADGRVLTLGGTYAL